MTTRVRQCKFCYRTLPLSCFHRDAKSAHGRHSKCKECKQPEIKARNAARSRLYIMYHGAKQRAKRDGREFTIVPDDIVIPSRCPVLGIKMDHPSLDRWDNRKGYTPENIRVISARANRLKNDATVAEVRKVLLYMTNNAPQLAVGKNSSRAR